jgi:hypothetical protein
MNSPSLKGAMLAAMPPAAALIIFYSLAAHMYLSLGQWPQSIGTNGFSPALLFHSEAQYWLIVVVGHLSIYVWPVAVIATALTAKTRRFLPYLGIYALAVLICWGLMYLAPRQFLYWWFD